MLYLTYPQPYGSAVTPNVNRYFAIPVFCSLISGPGRTRGERSIANALRGMLWAIDGGIVDYARTDAFPVEARIRAAGCGGVF